ncbi:hypothetical protein Syun_008292 [Stephania yunnanensis]|uniref:ULTRAPETALA1/2 SAND domain-containing protein n=1 Tax=Stephania yunnanensis TaxID=152371 RepID=A0AAP0KC93_9MAGN
MDEKKNSNKNVVVVVGDDDDDGDDDVMKMGLFSDEEVREISGLKRGGDFVEVTCGCTSHRYGDAVGKLRVFINGDLEICCECTPGCQEGHWGTLRPIMPAGPRGNNKLTPAAFEKHSGRETARKWKSNIWIIDQGEKVPLSKTVLLKYHNQASKNANGSHKTIMAVPFIVMSLFDVEDVIRREGSVSGPRKNAEYIMMHLLMLPGNVLNCHMTELLVML